MIKNLLDNNGFTLLEVMIALMILTIGMLGTGAMQLSSINRNSSSYYTTKATNLALDQIEQILAWDANDGRLTDNNVVAIPRRIGLLRDKINNPPISDPNKAIREINNDTADFLVLIDDFQIYYDITPSFDPVNGNRVGLDVQLYVVWTEGSVLKTVAMSTTKVI